MTKTQLKEFVRNHKKEIMFGTIAIVAITAECFICNKVKAKYVSSFGRLTEDPDSKWIFDLCNDIDLVKEGAKSYVPLPIDDIAKLLGEEQTIRDPDGKLMKVTGAILFGNEVVDT